MFGRSYRRKVPHVQNRVAEAYANGDRYADTNEPVAHYPVLDLSRPVRSATQAEIAAALGMTAPQVNSAWAQVRAKRGWQAV